MLIVKGALKLLKYTFFFYWPILGDSFTKIGTKDCKKKNIGAGYHD